MANAELPGNILPLTLQKLMHDHFERVSAEGNYSTPRIEFDRDLTFQSPEPILGATQFSFRSCITPVDVLAELYKQVRGREVVAGTPDTRLLDFQRLQLGARAFKLGLYLVEGQLPLHSDPALAYENAYVLMTSDGFPHAVSAAWLEEQTIKQFPASSAFFAPTEGIKYDTYIVGGLESEIPGIYQPLSEPICHALADAALKSAV